MTKKIEDLKKGDIFYSLEGIINIEKYEYISPLKENEGNYHILLYGGNEPIKMFVNELEEILRQKLNTRLEAEAFRINRVEEYLEGLKKTYEEKREKLNKIEAEKKESEFETGDWIIHDNCKKPMAAMIVEVTDKYYRTNKCLKDPDVFGFDKSSKHLRFATKEEIMKSIISENKHLSDNEPIPDEYIVKDKSVIVPFSWDHRDNLWRKVVVHKESEKEFVIIGLKKDFTGKFLIELDNDMFIDSKILLERYVFQNGDPCGIEEVLNFENRYYNYA